MRSMRPARCVFPRRANSTALACHRTGFSAHPRVYAVNATGTLRVSEEGELYGLDLHEHGISAYPEYVISAFASGGVPQPMQESPVLHAKAATAKVSTQTT